MSLLGSRRLHAVAVGVVGFLLAAALAYGFALSLSGGRHHARQEVAFLARHVQRAKAYRLGRCRRASGHRVSCPFTLTIRALSGGTIVCKSKITVTRRSRTAKWSDSFPRGRPRCVRHPPPSTGGR